MVCFIGFVIVVFIVHVIVDVIVVSAIASTVLYNAAAAAADGVRRGSMRVLVLGAMESQSSVLEGVAFVVIIANHVLGTITL